MGKKIIIKGADFSEYAVGASSAGTKVIVAFDTNGIGDVPYKRADKDEVVLLPTPSASGYEFLGWYRETSYTTLVENSVVASNNITLYAKWQSVETITYQADDWTIGKYRNMTPMTPQGAILTAFPSVSNSTRCNTRNFDISRGSSIELVTAVKSPSKALALFGVINPTTMEVVVERDWESNLLETPFTYTATEDVRLYVNVGNGNESGGYDASVDYTDDFRLTIKTPIPYGESL